MSSGDLSLLLQARALILCALPYKCSAERSVTRAARVGRNAVLRVTFTSIDEGVALPFGADRALFGWIQTRAYENGFVALDSLAGYFRAFGLGQSGREYRQFHERLRRIESLAISVRLESDEEEAGLRLHPLKRSLLPRRETLPSAPRTAAVVRRSRYGFQLDPEFWQYLRSNPVPLPLPLMRRFHNRPMAWDLAAFVLYRSYVAKAPAVIPWPDLMQQLGTVDRNSRRCRAALGRVLEEMQGELPEFHSRSLTGREGLAIEPWRSRP